MKQSLWRLVVCIAAFHCSLALITKIQCNTSDKGTCTDPFCNFTKNSSNVVIANYGCRDLTRSLDKILVHFKLYRKHRSQYYQVSYVPKFDYCNFDEKNVSYSVLKLLKKKIPESIHECPFTDSQLQANNLTLSKEDFRILSAGKYKVICTLSDEYDYKILKMITHVTI